MKILIITLFLSWGVHLGAQRADSVKMKPASVQVLADVQKDSISLRWAVDQALAWKLTNAYGFRLDRYTVQRNGIILDIPEKRTLGIFKPLPLNDWKPWVMKNDQAAIVAQSLYGEHFEVGKGEENSLARIVDLAQEQEQRFVYALMAADQDFQVAQLAGWGYVDRQVLREEKYLYKVTALTPADQLQAVGGVIEEGTVYVSVADYEPLPVPFELMAIAGDQQVLLSWNNVRLKQIYNAYYLEKSTDSLHFSRINNVALVDMNSTATKTAQSMFYTDSLAENGKPYYYRLQGVNSFGHTGPYTPVVKAMGVKALHAVPIITQAIIQDKGNSAFLTFEFDSTWEPYIQNFQLLRSDKQNGSYQEVSSSILPQLRNIKYAPLKPSNYFKIRAVGKGGDYKDSYPYFVQPIDSTPPAAPQNLKGSIDSLGVVHVHWKANTEPDLLGYRVYRGNIKDEDYVQMTSSPLSDTSFIDSVKLNSLNGQVFYTLVAVDQRFNLSNYSKVLVLNKPDIVPPQAPLISNYKVNDGEIEIQFIKSYSNDVAKHLLYRENLTDSAGMAPRLIFESTDSNKVFTYLDTDVTNATKYRYAVFAMDRSNLRSAPSQPLTVTAFSMKPKDLIKGLDVFVDREKGFIELFWRTNENLLSQVQVYKCSTGGKPSLLLEIPPAMKRIKDDKIHPGNTYTYFVKGVQKDGHFSNMEKIDVEF